MRDRIGDEQERTATVFETGNGNELINVETALVHLSLECCGVDRYRQKIERDIAEVLRPISETVHASAVESLNFPSPICGDGRRPSDPAVFNKAGMAHQPKIRANKLVAASQGYIRMRDCRSEMLGQTGADPIFRRQDKFRCSSPSAIACPHMEHACRFSFLMAP